MITQIFADLDGFLADWPSAAIRAHGGDPDLVLSSWPPGVADLADVLGVSKNKLWAPIHAQGSAFWSDLEPYPWAETVISVCREFGPVTVLTSPSLDPSSCSGKVEWLQRQFGRTFRDFLIGPDKKACARPGAVLIDDRDSACMEFVKRGGHAIVFPQPWNSRSDLAVGPRDSADGLIEYLRKELMAIEKKDAS